MVNSRDRDARQVLGERRQPLNPRPWLEHLVGVLFLPWFFLTPVLYGLDQLPAAANHRWLIHLLRYGNPVTPYLEGIRGVILQGNVPGPGLLAYIFVVLLLLLVLR